MDLKSQLRKAEIEIVEVRDYIRTAPSQADAVNLARQLTALQEKQRSLVVAIREEEGGVS
jgi:hypothetical protein